MPTPAYRFPPQQEAFLRAGRQVACAGASRGHASVSLVEAGGHRMPEPPRQDLQGTCVAHAVVGLLEFYGDYRARLSAQFLFTAAKKIERTGLERNFARLRAGESLDAAFETVFHAQLLQLRMFADVNGGMGAEAMRPHLTGFENAARARFAALPGCLVASAFRAVETMGVCRNALWPSATVQATSVFGGTDDALAFPPGTCEDARKRRITHGLYLLATPNNVDEIRGLLAGANGRRAMPVVAAVDFFAGCDGATYGFPETVEDAEGHLVSAAAWQGRHAVLLVGFRDDTAYAGGGYFVFRNSFGSDWGARGYGKMPYAYLECFAREAGTILQDRIDYEGEDGAAPSRVPARRRLPLAGRLAANLAIGLVLVGATWWWLDRRPSGEPRPAPERPGTVPAQRPGTVPAQAPGAAVAAPTVYKVFLSCADAAERRALRNALASEGVAYPVEFLPQTLETVLSVRVTMPEGDAYAAVAEILQRHYEGPRREFWTDVAGLTRSRAIYIVKAAVRQWEEQP